MNSHSALMLFFRKIKMEKVAWSLRRLHVPVKSHDLVLEVGSGGNPYARSNVLVDAYYETRERHYAPLITDRPTVLAQAEQLPFKDKVFDFVIASHVLEHSHQPEKFLNELMRVAKAGYIEVPDAFMERLIPYLDHRLEITDTNNQLIILKKKQRIVDPELNKLFQNKVGSFFSKKVISENPFSFHVRYYWSEKINFEIKNPAIDTHWIAEQTPHDNHSHQPISLQSKIKQSILLFLRTALSQTGRNKKIELKKLLISPCCHVDIIYKNDIPCCTRCDKTYKKTQGLYNFCF